MVVEPHAYPYAYVHAVVAGEAAVGVADAAESVEAEGDQDVSGNGAVDLISGLAGSWFLGPCQDRRMGD